LTRSFPKSREELVVLLPELAGSKCLNGVSWLTYETAMVLLDESTTCSKFDISLQDDSVTLDLLMYVVDKVANLQISILEHLGQENLLVPGRQGPKRY
jgi:hypothetical protein